MRWPPHKWSRKRSHKRNSNYTGGQEKEAEHEVMPMQDTEIEVMIEDGNTEEKREQILAVMIFSED